MNNFKKVLMLALLLMHSLSALANTTATRPDTTCKANPSDQYEPGVRMSAETFQNNDQCVDTTLFRHAIIIEDNQQHIKFANYYHQGKYWIATLKKAAKLSNTFYHVVMFDVVQGVTAAHTQIRAKLAAGSEMDLQSQDDPAIKAKANDLLISFEASRPKGVNYNFALGAMKSYAFVGRVTSGEAKLSEEGPTESTEQYAMQFPAGMTGLDMMIAGIRRSDRDKFNRYYDSLWPNCTTELFDLIDEMPAFASNNIERFLTVLSNDPVAGPSLKGMRDRGLIKARYSDLRDELEKGIVTAPQVTVKKKQVNLLAKIPNYPFSLVLVTNEDSQTSEIEKAIIKELSAELRTVGPNVIQSVGSSLMLGKDEALDVIKAALGGILKELLSKLPAMEKKLPAGKSLQVALYFTPWNQSEGKKMDPLVDSGVLIRLPFKTFKANQSDAFSTMISGYRKIFKEKSINKLPFNLLGTMVHLNVEKNKSEVTFQLNGRLTKIIKKGLNIVNPQIQLNEFEVPRVYPSTSQTIAIINLQQKASEAIPRMRIRFGADGGLKGRLKKSTYGHYQILENRDCEDRAMVVPRLVGELGRHAAGNPLMDFLIKNKDVALKIFDIDFDFNTFLIQDIDIRVATWPLDCYDMESVDEQVKSEANTTIHSSLMKVTGDADKVGSSVLNYIFAQ